MKYDIVDAFRMLCEDGSIWSSFSNTYASIEWSSRNNQTKPTEEQCNAKLTEITNAESGRLLRIERNRLIAETDWTQLKDIDLDIIRERNWKNYRQALRDLPANSNPKLTEFGTLDMSSVNWPDKPSS